MPKYIDTCVFSHPKLGNIRVKRHGSTKHISARWVDNEVRVVVPAFCLVECFYDFINANIDKILALRPQPKIQFDVLIDGCYADFIFKCESFGGRVKCTREKNNPLRGKKRNVIITVDRNYIASYGGISNPAVQNWLERILLNEAELSTIFDIIPHAQLKAKELGLSPREWKVRKARTKLGSCSSTGIITLSPQLGLMPPELVDYIICHELAHLTEMNHSAAFHKLCNQYCNGHEAEYSARVRKFKFIVS